MDRREPRRAAGLPSWKGIVFMNPKKWIVLSLALGFLALLSGCGSGGMNSSVMPPQSGTVFITGTDAPLPSVVSFQVDITGMTVSDGMNPLVSVLSGTQTVDFARLNGLRTLLYINTIKPGTYTTVNVSLANPQISFLNVVSPPTNPPTRPTLSMLNATTTPPVTLSQSSVTIN